MVSRQAGTRAGVFTSWCMCSSSGQLLGLPSPPGTFPQQKAWTSKFAQAVNLLGYICHSSASPQHADVKYTCLSLLRCEHMAEFPIMFAPKDAITASRHCPLCLSQRSRLTQAPRPVG